MAAILNNWLRDESTNVRCLKNEDEKEVLLPLRNLERFDVTGSPNAE